tara:strand:+ start:294 stop:407 length:114 start_codon:yes stop_codon:yes gene_type:complete
MSLQIIYDEIKKLDRKLNSIQVELVKQRLEEKKERNK